MAVRLKLKNTTKYNNNIRKQIGVNAFGENKPFIKSDAYYLSRNIGGIDVGENTKNANLRHANTIFITDNGRNTHLEANLLYNNASKIVVDAYGDLYNRYGDYIRRNDSAVFLYDRIHPEKSDYYNPFHYFYNEQGKINLLMIDEIFEIFYESLSREPVKGEEFWKHGIRSLFLALVIYVAESDDIDLKNKNFYTVQQLAFHSGHHDEKTLKQIRQFAATYSDSLCIKELELFEYLPEKTRADISLIISAGLKEFTNEPYEWPDCYDGNYRFTPGVIDLTLLPEASTDLFVCLIPGKHSGREFKTRCLLLQAAMICYDASFPRKEAYVMLKGTSPVLPFSEKEAVLFIDACKKYDDTEGDLQIVQYPEYDYYILMWKKEPKIASADKLYLLNVINDIKFGDPVIKTNKGKIPVQRCQCMISFFDMNVNQYIVPNMDYYMAMSRVSGFSFYISISANYLEKEMEMYKKDWKTGNLKNDNMKFCDDLWEHAAIHATDGIRKETIARFFDEKKYKSIMKCVENYIINVRGYKTIVDEPFDIPYEKM